ncbi:MAG: hypothetical protein ACT4P4_29675 [Betaproteobacteria bacterium]
MSADKPKPFTMRGSEKMQTQRNADGTLSVRSSEAMALEVRFAYNDKGELMEFSVNNIGAEILQGERILLKKAVK